MVFFQFQVPLTDGSSLQANNLTITLVTNYHQLTLLEFFEKVQDSPIFILYSSIGLLWTLAQDFFKTRTKNTLRLAGLKAKVCTFYTVWNVVTFSLYYL